MGLFNKHNNDTNVNNSYAGTNAGVPSNAEVDPMYNNEAGVGNYQAGGGGLAGYHVPGVGPVSVGQAQQMQTPNYGSGYDGKGTGVGTGLGHRNDAVPQGGVGQGNNVNFDNAAYGRTNATADHGHHGHAGRDAALLGAGGAAYGEHEHHKHQNQSTNLSGGGGPNTYGNTGYDTAGTNVNNPNLGGGYNDGMGAGGVTSNQAGTGPGMGVASNNQTGQGQGQGMGVMSNQSSVIPNAADAKKLDRSGRLDKVVGTLIGSSKLKQEGLQKRADAAAMNEQGRHLGVAEKLEAEAQRRRGHAVGLGAHPSHAMVAGQQAGVGNSGVQPGYGTTGGGRPVM